jgi:alpha-beta hydrolase superfamily lysophospholipase
VPPLLVDALIVLLAAATLTLLAAWLAAGQAIRRRKPDPRRLPDAVGVPFEFVTLHARDGLELAGRYSGQRDGRPTVIMAAGQFGSMDGDTDFVPVLVRGGFDVLQFDWRAHGSSEGRHTTFGVREVDDLRGAVDFLQGRGVKRIGVVGFSMGGAIALRAAAADGRIACVVADGPFTDLASSMGSFIRGKVGLPLWPLVGLVMAFTRLRLGGTDPREASPLGSVAAISPRPVLFIHGTDDPLVPPADQEALYAACGAPKTLWQVEGAGHRGAMQAQPAAYERRVVGFFKSHLT